MDRYWNKWSLLYRQKEPKQPQMRALCCFYWFCCLFFFWDQFASFFGHFLNVCGHFVSYLPLCLIIFQLFVVIWCLVLLLFNYLWLFCVFQTVNINTRVILPHDSLGLCPVGPFSEQSILGGHKKPLYCAHDKVFMYGKLGWFT